jgi:hypothetical protein
MTDPEFHAEAAGFDAQNACWLCEAAKWLAGDDASMARKRLARSGLPRFVWFCHQDVRAFVAGNSGFLVAVFQGADGASILNRLAVDPQPFAPTPLGRVNASIWRDFSLVGSSVLDAIAAMRDSRQRVWTAGHGLGGAFAILAAGFLEKERQIPVQGVVTFGAPRVGHREFAANFHQSAIGGSSMLLDRTVRIVHSADPFTAVPPTADDYAAIGSKYHFDERGRLLGTTEADRTDLNRLVTTAESASQEFNPPELSEHGIEAYCRLMRAENAETSVQHS